MAGILTFDQFIGGPAVLGGEITTQDQKSITMTLKDSNGDALDLTSYTFDVDYQTIVVDTLAYDRNTGVPNFSSSTVAGTFAQGEVDVATYLNKADTTGVFTLTLPAGMYSGPVIPNARTNVPIVVVSIKVNNGETPARIDTYRLAYIIRFSPDDATTVGDPTADSGYTAIV